MGTAVADMRFTSTLVAFAVIPKLEMQDLARTPSFILKKIILVIDPHSVLVDQHPDQCRQTPKAWWFLYHRLSLLWVARSCETKPPSCRRLTAPPEPRPRSIDGHTLNDAA